MNNFIDSNNVLFDIPSSKDVQTKVDHHANVIIDYGIYKEQHYWMARVLKKFYGNGENIQPELYIKENGGITASDLAQKRDFTLAINAGVFRTSGTVQCGGTTIKDGVVVSDRRWGGIDQNTNVKGADVLCMTEDGTMFSLSCDIPASEMISEHNVYNAVQVFGTIISNGEVADLEALKETLKHAINDQSSFVETAGCRTVVGQFANGDYLVFSVSEINNHDGGLNMPDIAELLLSKGVTFAYNLDGGGSTTLIYRKSELAYFHEDIRKMPSYLIFE